MLLFLCILSPAPISCFPGRRLVYRKPEASAGIAEQRHDPRARLRLSVVVLNLWEGGITREGQVRGTVPFMPPEQVLDSRFVKPAGDIYAAGATLYWLLTGDYVYDFEARDARGEIKDAYGIIDEDEPPIPIRTRQPAIPEPLARTVHQALAYDPEARFPSAQAMARALRDSLH
jgi:serine/threonine-protein kinase